MQTSPCLNCLERNIGCHGQCDRYAAFRDKRNEINQAKYEALEKDDIEIQHRIKTNRKRFGTRYKRRQG